LKHDDWKEDRRYVREEQLFSVKDIFRKKGKIEVSPFKKGGLRGILQLQGFQIPPRPLPQGHFLGRFAKGGESM